MRTLGRSVTATAKAIFITGLVSLSAIVAVRSTLNNVSRLFSFSSTIQSDVTVTYAALQQVQELVTVRQPAVEVVHKNQDRRLGGKLLVGNTLLIYRAAGEIQAGFDLAQAVVREAPGEAIEVVLPPPHISNVFIDVEKSDSIYHEKNWFAPDTELELQEAAQREALQRMVQSACKTQILETANQQAKQKLELLLNEASIAPVVVTTQNPIDGNNCPAFHTSQG
ncbi:MAG: DUF4230 domain-containing protein [Microcoleaceae cyanobacterium]